MPANIATALAASTTSIEPSAIRIVSPIAGPAMISPRGSIGLGENLGTVVDHATRAETPDNSARAALVVVINMGPDRR
jgi:hypothetical protein